MTSKYIREFRAKLEEQPKERLLEIIEDQNPEFIAQIKRIEYVFANKLNHLKWNDGTPVTGRPLTKEELALLVDPPFKPDKDLTDMGLDYAKQREVHIASDVVLWAREYLDAKPRVYQVLMLRDPSLRKVLRLGRRSGKSFSMAIMLMHYAHNTKNGRCLVMAPMKSQVSLIYEECIKLAKQGKASEAITRSIQSPQHEIHLSTGSTIRFFTTGMRSGMKCLTPDHDVLTKEDGWKPIADVEAGEIVATWKEGHLFWSEAKAVWDYEYEGPMLDYQGRGLRFTATPNHMWRVISRAGGSRRTLKGTYLLDSTELRSNVLIPASGSSMPPTTETYSGAELEMWGWWLSEGSGFDSNMVRISQQKPHGKKRIIEVAQELGVHYTEYEKEIRVSWRPPEFSGVNAYDKFIPRSLLSEAHRDRLLQGLMAGDGTPINEGWAYSSSSEKLVDGVQELAFLEGFRVFKNRQKLNYKPVDGGDPNPHWRLSLHPYKAWTYNNMNAKWIPYKGKVHCITVPETGLFVARKRDGGGAFVTGNSDVARGQEAHMIILDEMDYMGIDDLDALYAMLQKTDENQPDKVMVGASTPSGRRERFYQWALGLSPDGTKLPEGLRFKEFWFPSMVNPLWDKDTETEMRNQYSENAFRHEIEADWGEDAEGVYPRRYVERAFISPVWKYIDSPQSARSDFVIGVDWDKFGAGPNLCVLEVCSENYEEERFASKLKLAYRQEIPRGDYVLSEAVKRVIELNREFQPKHIYIDKGYGEVQYELLMKHGVENPETRLRERVKGISFGGTIEIRDPSTKQKIKKDTKPYMVENLRTMLERDQILFPEDDEELYLQLISYVVVRMSAFGKPVFGSSGSQVDHAHDALALACLAYSDNYGEFNKLSLARHARSISHNLLLPTQQSKESDPRSTGDPFEPRDYSESDTPKRPRRRNLAARSVSYSRSINRRNI